MREKITPVLCKKCIHYDNGGFPDDLIQMCKRKGKSEANLVTGEVHDLTEDPRKERCIGMNWFEEKYAVLIEERCGKIGRYFIPKGETK